MIYADQNLPATRPTKRNPGRTARTSRRLTPGQRNFGDSLGAYNLRGLGDGMGSIPWQSEVVPAQLHPSPKWDPQQRLCFAILQDAIEVYWKGRLFPSTRIQRLAREAEKWIRADDDDWVFSFVCICEALGWDVGCMRAGVLGEKKAA